MTSSAFSSKKKKKVNPIIAYFVPFGVRQATEIGILAASIVCIVGFFTNDVVLIVGISIMLASAFAGACRAAMLVLKYKSDTKGRPFRASLFLLVFLAVLAIIAIVGLILYVAV